MVDIHLSQEIHSSTQATGQVSMKAALPVFTANFEPAEVGQRNRDFSVRKAESTGLSKRAPLVLFAQWGG
jgi:hypothetical protein